MGRFTDWKEKAEVNADVVFFNYLKEGQQNQAGEVYIWDLDKTYLDTDLGTLREIWRTAVEKAFQKRNVPGTRSLVLALKQGWEATHGKNKPFPIYFITASPPQMEKAIKEKLELDKIYPFGGFYKDNLQNWKPKAWWRLTQQVGYKLQALLQLRMGLFEDVRQILWGDDSEADAVIYNLFSDICARRLEPPEIQSILKSFRVVGEQTEIILDLQSRLPKHDPVEKIYINLAVDTDPEYYVKFGRRTVPTYNTFQIAVDLVQDGRLQPQDVVLVAEDLIKNYRFTIDELMFAIDDLVRRQIVGEPCVEKLLPVLKEKALVNQEYQPSMAPKKVSDQVDGRVFGLEGSHEPWVPEHIDYLHDYR